MTIRTASHETPAGSRSSRARRAAAALVACLAVALLILPGCTSTGGSNAETIRVGVCAGPYQDMFEQAIEPSLTEQGYSVKYVEFSDYVRAEGANDQIDRATAHLRGQVEHLEVLKHAG